MFSRPIRCGDRPSVWQGAEVTTENGWTKRLKWSYWDLAADFPRTRPFIIGLRVLSLVIAVPIGAVMLAGLAVSLLSSDGDGILALLCGMGFLFCVLGGWYSLWDLRCLIRRQPRAEDS